jgi:hypothetical protein
LSGFKKMKANNSNVWICKRQERKNAGANFWVCSGKNGKRKDIMEKSETSCKNNDFFKSVSLIYVKVMNDWLYLIRYFKLK